MVRRGAIARVTFTTTVVNNIIKTWRYFRNKFKHLKCLFTRSNIKLIGGIVISACPIVESGENWKS